MRIENSDSISTMNSGNVNHSAAAVKRVSMVDFEQTMGGKDLSQPNIRCISQLNEYDKSIMPVSEKVIIEAIEKANKAISGGNRRFEFSIHEETNQIMVKVFDTNTEELIKEIPNEKILDMVAKICEMAGILVDERR